RQDRENILDLTRKGIAQLTRLRHPQILTVQHPLEESRDCLAFATEPVFCSLANALGQWENMPQESLNRAKDYKMFDVEIKYGLLQLCEGLTFLHEGVKLLHRNICPESVIINYQGAWKIFGFDYCILNSGSPEASLLGSSRSIITGSYLSASRIWTSWPPNMPLQERVPLLLICTPLE
ncbi:SCY1like protein 2like, partial [Caligus rogercresseyi]